MKKVISHQLQIYEPFSGLNKQSAINRVKCEYSQMPFLSNIIIKPFEEGLENLVDSTIEEMDKLKSKTFRYEIDGVEFKVKCYIKEVKSSPKEVYDDLVYYLKKIRNEYRKGIKRKGIITYQNEPYINVKLVLEQINEKSDYIKDRYLRKNIVLDNQLENQEPQAFSAPLVNYSTLKGLAAPYLKARVLYKYDFDKILKPFDDALKKYTGYSKENIPEKTQDVWHHETGISFMILSIPAPSISYLAIINQLAKKTKKITASTGDLVKILMRAEDENTKKYNTISRGDNKFVSISSLVKNIERIKEENTTKRLSQKIYPITDLVIK